MPRPSCLHLQCALSKFRQLFVTGTDGDTLANQLKLLAKLLEVGVFGQQHQAVDDLYWRRRGDRICPSGRLIAITMASKAWQMTPL
jgi:hypothetical protein